MKLIIFDLDQTLVDFISVHDITTEVLFHRLFNVDARLTGVDFAGRSLGDNFAVLARHQGIPGRIFKEKLPELLREYDRLFRQNIPADGDKYVLPGVRELLNALTEAGHLLMLYTGDSPEVARASLQSADLSRYFKTAFFGTEVSTRADMIKLAIQKAEQLTGKRFKGKEIIIIGDSVRDIECGKEFGALIIAVNTGFHSAARLEAAGPDYLFRNLTDYRRVLDAVG
jgi:phosphoglycolate phosphatase